MHKIGGTIRELRKQRRLTLDLVAQRTGLTPGYLSKIERDLSSPPLSTVIRLAAALGVEMADFFPQSPGDAKCVIVRQGERRGITRDGAGLTYDYESLTYPKRQGSMEAFVLTVFPGQPEQSLTSHRGAEIAFVLSGRVELTVNEERHVLNPGDCAYFESSEPHRIKNVGKSKAQVFLVISRVEG